MLLYVDPREGSKKFLKEFDGESQELMLDGGDIAFWGNGPDDIPWFVGIEFTAFVAAKGHPTIKLLGSN